MKKCILVDGNALMHRSYHGVNKGFIPIFNNMKVGMVYGFCSTILNAMEFFHPEVLIITFDTKEATFRHQMDENYKAHREKAPDDFYPQIPFIFEFLESADIQVLKKSGFESDDLIGTLAIKVSQEKDYEVNILSGDLDFLQLVSDKIKLVKFNGNLANSIIYGYAETVARYGITPAQIVDFKAISGDSSDNYKGVTGIGEKGAEKLLQEYATLENIYNNLNKLPEKTRNKFEKDREYVFHCQKLAKIHTKVEIDFNLNKFHFDLEKTKTFFNKMGFQILNNRYEKLVNNYDKKITPNSNKQNKIPNQMKLL